MRYTSVHIFPECSYPISDSIEEGYEKRRTCKKCYNFQVSSTEIRENETTDNLDNLKD